MKYENKTWNVRSLSLGATLGVLMGSAYLLLQHQPNDNALLNAVPVSFNYDEPIVNKVEQPSVSTATKPTLEKPEPIVDKSVPIQETKPASIVTLIQAPKPTAKLESIQPEKKIISVAKQPTKMMMNEERALLAMPSQHYTIQLFGTHQESSAKQFIARNQLSTQARYFKSQRAGKAWFTIVYGNYSTLAQAKAGLATLALPGLAPWIRPLQQVQGEIKREHDLHS